MVKGLRNKILIPALAALALLPNISNAQENTSENLCLKPVAAPERTVGQFKPLISIATPDTLATSYIDSTTADSITTQTGLGLGLAREENGLLQNMAEGNFDWSGEGNELQKIPTRDLNIRSISGRSEFSRRLRNHEISSPVVSTQTNSTTEDSIATQSKAIEEDLADPFVSSYISPVEAQGNASTLLERNFIFSSDSSLSAAGEQGILLKNYVPMQVSTADTTNFNNTFYSNYGDLHFSFTSARKTLEDALKRSASDSSVTGIAFRRQIRRFLKNQASADSTSVAKLDAAVHEDGTLSPEDDLSNVVSGRYSLVVSNDTETLPMVIGITVPEYLNSTTAIKDSAISAADSSATSTPTNYALTDSTNTTPSDPTSTNMGVKAGSLDGRILGIRTGMTTKTKDLGIFGNIRSGNWSFSPFVSKLFGDTNYDSNTENLDSRRTLIGPGTYETRTDTRTTDSDSRNLYDAGIEIARGIKGRLSAFVTGGVRAEKVKEENINSSRIIVTRNEEVLRDDLLSTIPTTQERINLGLMIGTGLKYNVTGGISADVGIYNTNQGEARGGLKFGI